MEKKGKINRPRPRHGHIYSKYKKCLIMMMLICIKQSTFEAQFMKQLSSTEGELKKSVAYKKACFHWKIPMLDFLFNNVAALLACKFIKKETLTQVLSCEL